MCLYILQLSVSLFYSRLSHTEGFVMFYSGLMHTAKRNQHHRIILRRWCIPIVCVQYGLLTQSTNITAHYIRAVTPDVKLLIILRNPVDRCMCLAYHFFSQNILNEDALLVWVWPRTWQFSDTTLMVFKIVVVSQNTIMKHDNLSDAQQLSSICFCSLNILVSNIL